MNEVFIAVLVCAVSATLWILIKFYKQHKTTSMVASTSASAISREEERKRIEKIREKQQEQFTRETHEYVKRKAEEEHAAKIKALESDLAASTGNGHRLGNGNDDYLPLSGGSQHQQQAHRFNFREERCRGKG